MKRNWDTLRKIMLQLECVPSDAAPLESNTITGVDNEAAFYHMRLLIEAGLAVGGCPEMLGGTSHGYLYRLSWEGHELLDKIRRDTVWNKVKEIARTKGIDLSVDILKTLATSVLASLLA